MAEAVVIDKPAAPAAPAAAPAKADDGEGKTVLQSADDGKAKAPVEDWAPDWRQKISADEKHKAQLDRFASPKALAESYFALQQKMSSGELKTNIPFPEKGTDEEKATWRKDNGIPVKAEEYDLKGVTIRDGDKPFVDKFLEAAIGQNMPPQYAKAALGWYFSTLEEANAAQEQKDQSTKTATEDSLRTEWGQDYRRNVNLVKGLLSTAPQGLDEKIMESRMPDGTALFNDPDVMRFFISMAKTINPVSTVVPNAGANVASAIDDEIKQIEGMMRTDRKAYNKDQKAQERLRELYTARGRIK